MGLLSRAARLVGRAAIGARRGGARSLIGEAREFADVSDALTNYALVSGSLGGLGGMLMSGNDVASRGGTQDDINEAAYYGGRMGAGMGAATLGPAIALAAGTNGVGGGLGALPWILYTGSEGSRRFDERRRKREQDEAAMRAIEMRLNMNHRPSAGRLTEGGF